MKLNLALYLTLTTSLAGCTSTDPNEDQGRLSLACEVVQCECLPPKTMWSLKERAGQPLLWRADGSAYCSEGYYLSRVK